MLCLVKLKLLFKVLHNGGSGLFQNFLEGDFLCIDLGCRRTLKGDTLDGETLAIPGFQPSTHIIQLHDISIIQAMISLSNCDNGNRFSRLETGNVEQFGTLQDFQITHGQETGRLSQFVSNFVLGAKITKNGSRNTMIASQNKGNIVLTTNVVDFQEIGDGRQARHHDSRVRFTRAYYVGIKQDRFVNRSSVEHLHLAKRIQGLQFGLRSIGARRFGLRIGTCQIEICTEIRQYRRVWIPQSDTPDIGKNQVLGRFDTDTLHS
mmetsp:Transcript_8060/g.15609  ORF Transcript_8060/g.15609 Transcript_8060/m.15609 type:complete len:263 (-) Transcript_8060:207-995(-)